MTRIPSKAENIVEAIQLLRVLATAPRHNDIRFDINLAHIYPMIEAGEIQMPDLIEKVRKAITDTIDHETNWRQHPGASIVRSTGGDGRRDEPLHDGVIVYDFS